MATTGSVWIQVGQTDRLANLEDRAPLDRSVVFPWQAIFACQVWPRPFDIRRKYQWGFNLGALLDEAQDRQRLFIESQHPADIRAQQDPPERRTLGLRVIAGYRSEELTIGLLGKVCGPTEAAAREKAREYLQEICSTLPYDYEVVPAGDQAQFQRLAGWEILQSTPTLESRVNLRRLESLFNYENESLYLLGGWQTTSRADEILWRAMAGAQQPVLMNVLLRPTILLEYERALLAKQAAAAQRLSRVGSSLEQQPYLERVADSIAQRAASFVRPYSLQVHFAAHGRVPEYLSRVAGAALTRSQTEKKGEAGFVGLYPTSDEEAVVWSAYIYWLDFLPVPPLGLVSPHLRDLAGVEEVYSVFHLPFTHQVDFPGLQIQGMARTRPEAPADPDNLAI